WISRRYQRAAAQRLTIQLLARRKIDERGFFGIETIHAHNTVGPGKGEGIFHRSAECAGNSDFLLRGQIDDDLFLGPGGSREIACVRRKAQGNDFRMYEEIEEF